MTADRTVRLDVAEREAVLLALAILSLDRPGWHDYLREIAERVAAERPGGGGEAFDKFRQFNANRWQQRPIVRSAGDMRRK